MFSHESGEEQARDSLGQYGGLDLAAGLEPGVGVVEHAQQQHGVRLAPVRALLSFYY